MQEPGPPSNTWTPTSKDKPSPKEKATSFTRELRGLRVQAEKQKEDAGRSEKGRQLAIMSTELEKLAALAAYWRL